MIDKSLVAYNNNRPFSVMTIIIPTRVNHYFPVGNYSLLTIIPFYKKIANIVKNFAIILSRS